MARILVADDEPPMRQMVRLACERLGHSVFEAVNSHGAIEAYGRIAPDLLVLDMNMPGGGGAYVLTTLRFSGKSRMSPVLVISGSIEKSSEELRSVLRVERVLAKPFRINDLVLAVTELLAPAAGRAPPSAAS